MHAIWPMKISPVSCTRLCMRHASLRMLYNSISSNEIVRESCFFAHRVLKPSFYKIGHGTRLSFASTIKNGKADE